MDAYRPQLAELVKQAPDGPGWLHELKHDGYRIGCDLRDGRVRLLSRRGRDWTRAFPEVAQAAARLAAHDALLDGEVAVLLADGRTSFQALQAAVDQPPPREGLVYFAFDLLRLDGEDLTGLPLERRKQALEHLLARSPGAPVLRYSSHVVGGGASFHEAACRHRAEGIVSKRRDGTYREGRGGGWVKTKCTHRQELVIGGFTEPTRQDGGIGALLVGYHRGERLVFAGKVGTGFTREQARALRARLAPLVQRACPFRPRPAGWIGARGRWVEPRLVCEVEFSEWTRGGHVRHPSFRGLRADKPAREVVREEPTDEPAARSPSPPPPRAAQRARGRPVAVAGVVISHPERLMFPDVGLTKLDLARYMEAVAPWALPHVRGRPLTLLRCGTGIEGGCAFMKHSRVWAPPALRRVRIQEKTKLGEYLVVDDAAGLVSLAQMDVVEVHTWNSTTDALEQPDRVVLDLDPGPDVPWAEVVEAARLLRDLLSALGLVSLVKTTGGAGLHVVVPLAPEAPWTACLRFARDMAAALVHERPRRFTTRYAKRGRERRILVDYLRNNRTNTSVAAYSVRARPGAPVSVPIAWDELEPGLRSDRWDARSVLDRLARLGEDPWAAQLGSPQRLPTRSSGTARREPSVRPGRRG